MDEIGYLLAGMLVGAAIMRGWMRGGEPGASEESGNNAKETGKSAIVPGLLRSHFHPVPVGDITVSERKFPLRVRADLQRAIDRLFGEETPIVHFFGVRREYSHEGIRFSDCIVESRNNPAQAVPPEYEEIDIGNDEPIRVLKNGLWLLERDGIRFAVLLAPTGRFGNVTGMQFQVGTPNSADGTRITQEFFKYLEDSILNAESYRGKILSLELSEHSYSGESTGITVHKLRTVERDQVILPETTLALLERNVIHCITVRCARRLR